MFCISYSYDCKNHNIIKMYSLYLPNARMSQSAVTHLSLKSLSTAKLGKKQRDYKETNLSITDSKFLSDCCYCFCTRLENSICPLSMSGFCRMMSDIFTVS